MPRLLFEIKYGDWEKALSYETTDFVNGTFRTFSNCDPFKNRGTFTPTNAVSEIGSGTISSTKTIRAILPVNASAAGQFYALGDDFKLYLIGSDNAVSDVSAQIGTGTAASKDLAVWLGVLVYVMGSGTNRQVRSNIIPVSSGSDAQLYDLAGAGVTATSNFCIGPDGNGYLGCGNVVKVFTNSTGTSGNGTTVAASFPTNGVVHKLLNDGRYLIFIGTRGLDENLDIVVAYWNLASANFDQIWQWNGGFFGGAEIIDDFIKIVSTKGVWVCNFATKPKLIIPFGGTIDTTDTPYSSDTGSNLSKLTGISNKGWMYWASFGTSGASTKIIGYGNPVYGSPNRLFQFGTSPNSYTHAIACNNDGKFIISTGNGSSVKLYALQGSASLNTSIVNVAGFGLPRTYNFHSAKIVTKSPISSGNSVSLQILSSNSSKTILASTTKTNSTDPGQRNLTYDHVTSGDSSDVINFDDISDIKITTNVAIHSLKVFGELTDERSAYA